MFSRTRSCNTRRLANVAGDAAVQGMTACDALNRCLDSLAADYPSVKFCRIAASEARLSINFVRVSFSLNSDIFYLTRVVRKRWVAWWHNDEGLTSCLDRFRCVEFDARQLHSVAWWSMPLILCCHSVLSIFKNSAVQHTEHRILWTIESCKELQRLVIS